VKYLRVVFVLVVTAVAVAAQTVFIPMVNHAERARFEELRRSGLDALWNH
jgi:hypothetical protein